MSPWNYPVLLTLEPLVDAIAAGNTAVVKPSAYAPASANVLKDLLEEWIVKDSVCRKDMKSLVLYKQKKKFQKFQKISLTNRTKRANIHIVSRT